MRGEIEEVQERIKNQAVLFVDLNQYEEWKEKARMYDLICEITRRSDRGLT